jgi:hypothetical protein
MKPDLLKVTLLCHTNTDRIRKDKKEDGLFFRLKENSGEL